MHETLENHSRCACGMDKGRKNFSPSKGLTNNISAIVKSGFSVLAHSKASWETGLGDS